MTAFCCAVEIAVCLLWPLCGAQPAGADSPRHCLKLDKNTKCVDLSDLKGELPLEVTRFAQILWQTESWERSA